MRRKALSAVIAAVAAVAWLGWWLLDDAPRRPPRAASKAHALPPGPAPETTDAPAAREPAQVETVAATREATTTPAGSDPAATWIVEGRVLRGWKEPYPGVGVRLRLFDGYEAAGEPIAEVRLESDEEGCFRWPVALPPTTVTLQCAGDEEGHFSHEQTAVAVAGRPPPRLEIRLYPEDCEITGIVRDEAGRPLRDVAMSSWVGEARSGEDGRYRIAASSIGGGAYVVATAPGYAQSRVVAQLPGPGSRAVADFDLVPAFRVKGRVVDEDGRPVEGAVVRSFFTGSQNVATTDGEGGFRLDHLDPRRSSHSVYARKEGYCEAATSVEVDGAERAIPDLVLARGVRLEGRVLDDAGAPLAGASLYIGFSPSAYNRLDAVSRDDGSFVFPNVPAGEQTLAASHPDCAPDRRLLSLAPAPPIVADLVVRLEKAHSIGGVVRDEAGKPRARIGIAVKHAGEYVDSLRGETAADGRFQVKGLPARDVALELYGGGIVRKSMALEALDHDGLEIVVQSAGRAAGRVVDGVTGEPLEEFVIRFIGIGRSADGGSTFGYSATWAREGHRFTRTGGRWDSGDQELPPGGGITIEARADGYAPARGEVVVAVDPDPDACVLRMRAGTRVRGRVVTADGAAASGARVAIRSAGDPDRRFSDEPYDAGTTQCGDDGTFEFKAAMAGASVLLVQAARRPLFVDGPFDVPLDGSVDRLVQLPRGTVLTGELLDARGAPLPDEAIALYAVEAGAEHHSAAATTGADGRFEFPGLPDGVYQVGHQVKDGGRSTYVITRFVRALSGQESHVVLQPVGDGAIAGTIRLKDGGAAPERLPVMCNAVHDPTRSLEQSPAGRGTIARDGRFEIDHLPPGDFMLRVLHWTANRRLQGSARVTVSHDRSDVVIELEELPGRR